MEEIQEKMDSWLKYSKKTLKKSDDNTENVFGKIEATNDYLATLRDEMKAEFEAIAAKVEDVEAAAALGSKNNKQGGGIRHIYTFKLYYFLKIFASADLYICMEGRKDQVMPHFLNMSNSFRQRRPRWTMRRTPSWSTRLGVSWSARWRKSSRRSTPT